MEIIDPGHVYDLWQLGSDQSCRLTFVKRNGGSVCREEEWPGVQTQEVLRALIDRTEFLNDILPCVESQDALYHLRMALWNYEARAYRRKIEHVNRQDPAHDDSVSPKPWRTLISDDIPFTEDDIETRPIGPDGHIVLTDKELLHASHTNCQSQSPSESLE